MLKIFKKSLSKKVEGSGLALFRIFYAIVLLCEIAQLYYFRHLIFDNVPYLDSAEIDFSIPIAIWFVVVVFLLLGFLTRFVTVLNYMLTLILLGSISQFEYHVFYAYLGLNFLMIFIPVSNNFSIDRLLNKIKYSNTTFQYKPTTKVKQFYYFIIPFVGLGIVYLDSVFYKIVTPMWYEGLGTWLPSSLPMITHFDTSFFLNNEWVSKGLGWLTILFEGLFIFVFFRTKWRLPCAIIGILLHLGILVAFPIPWFALTAVSVYILLIPLSYWKIFNGRREHYSLNVYYDAECPLCVRTKITIKHFDYFNKVNFKTVQVNAAKNELLKNIEEEKLLLDIHSTDLKGNVYNGIDTYIQIFKRIWFLKPLSLVIALPGIKGLSKKIYNYVASNRNVERCTEENCGYNPPEIINTEEIKILKNFTVGDFRKKLWLGFIVFVCFTQAIAISHSWSFEKLSNTLTLADTQVNKIYNKVTKKYLYYTRIYLGLTQHQVFTDRIHFNNYNHIISVYYEDNSGNQIRLPIIDEEGKPDLYIYGANWVNWTFRVNGMDVEMKKLSKGVQRYTAFWAHKNNIDLDDAKFILKVKKVESPTGWEKDFLNNQLSNPWMNGGEVRWKNKEFYPNIKDIEKL